MFQAYYQEEKDIGDVNVLTELAGRIGLDEGDFKEALLTRKYKEIQQNYLEEANPNQAYESLRKRQLSGDLGRPGRRGASGCIPWQQKYVKITRKSGKTTDGC